MSKLFHLIPIILFLWSCQTSKEVADSSLYGSALTGAASYLAYSEIKELYQNSAIKFQVPNDFYAAEITPEELFAFMQNVSIDPTFPTIMAYMGTRDGYEFYLYKLTFHTHYCAIFMNFPSFYGEMKALGSTLRALRYSS